jgi:hypothetical protein
MRAAGALSFDALADLRQNGDPSAQRLARALDAAWPDGPFGDDLLAIRAARQAMLIDGSRVEILNYGAGTRESSRPRSPEESEAGYVTHSLRGGRLPSSGSEATEGAHPVLARP